MDLYYVFNITEFRHKGSHNNGLEFLGENIDFDISGYFVISEFDIEEVDCIMMLVILVLKTNRISYNVVYFNLQINLWEVWSLWLTYAWFLLHLVLAYIVAEYCGIFTKAHFLILLSILTAEYFQKATTYHPTVN